MSVSAGVDPLADFLKLEMTGKNLADIRLSRIIATSKKYG